MAEIIESGNGKEIIKNDDQSYEYHLSDEVLQKDVFGVMEFLLQDDALEEIVYNGPQGMKVYHHSYGFCNTNFIAENKQVYAWVINVVKLNKKIINEQTPLFDGSLLDGSRINITIPPASAYCTFTVRKFKQTMITPIDLIKSDLFDSYTAAFLWTAIEGLGAKPANVLVVGGTGSGKTTLLNALTLFMPANQRIVTIEDTAELQILHPNRVKMISNKAANVTMDDLLKNALRMRPDRILVGEVRGSEAVTLFEAMNTGHDGTMGTLHADTGRDAVTRIISNPMNVPNVMLGVLDLIVVLKRIATPKGAQRIVQEITEISTASGDIAFNTIMQYDAKLKKLVNTGIPSRLRATISGQAGLKPTDFENIVKDRAQLLDSLLTQNLEPWYAFHSFDNLRNHWLQEKDNHPSLIKKVMSLFVR